MRNIFVKSFVIQLFLSIPFTTILAEPHTKIGVVIPLSGVAAEFGVAMRNGISLAMEDNKEKVNGCQFIYEDSEYNSAKTATIFHSLAESGIDIVYAFGGPMSEIIAPLAEVKRIPFINDSINPKLPVGKSFSFRYINTGLEFGTAMVNHLVSSGKKRIVIVKTENQYLNALVSGILESAKDKFETIDVIEINPDDFDFKPILPKILKGKYDSIGVFMLPGQGSSLAKLFKDRSDQYTFFGSDFMESRQEVKLSLGVLEGAVYANNYVSDSFKDRFMARFQNDNQLKSAGEAYDVASLLIDNICTKETKPSKEQMLDLIKSVKVRDGIQGRTEYVETAAGDKYFKAPVHIMKASTNGFEPVVLEGSK